MPQPKKSQDAKIARCALPPRGAYTVAEFAEAHRISEAFVYKLMSQGEGPAVMKLGTRTLISFEAAAAWRAEREAATAAAAAA